MPGRFLVLLLLLAVLPGAILRAQQPAPSTAPAPAVNSPAATTAPDPDENAAAYVKHGIANGQDGNLPAALAAFDKALQLDPQYAPAYENRGYAKFLQHNLAGAIADYDKAVQLDPKYVEAFYNRGVAKARNGAIDAAMADFDHVIRLDPHYAAAYYNRGHGAYFKGNLDAALADLNQAIVLDAGSPYPYFIRGLVRHAQNDRNGAISDFEKSIRPNFIYGMFWLWIVQTEGGDQAGARSTLADNSTRPGISGNGAWPQPVTDLLLGKSTRDQLLATARAQPSDAVKDAVCEACFYSGMALHLAGDNKGALDSFIQAIASAPKDSEEGIEAQRAAAAIAQTQ